jgi:hypothetical protein
MADVPLDAMEQVVWPLPWQHTHTAASEEELCEDLTVQSMWGVEEYLLNKGPEVDGQDDQKVSHVHVHSPIADDTAPSRVQDELTAEEEEAVAIAAATKAAAVSAAEVEEARLHAEEMAALTADDFEELP